MRPGSALVRGPCSETCKASSWQKMSSWISDYGSWPAVDTVCNGPADSNGCDSKLTANITIGFYRDSCPSTVRCRCRSCS